MDTNLTPEEIEKISNETIDKYETSDIIDRPRHISYAFVKAGAEAQRVKLAVPDKEMVEVVADSISNYLKEQGLKLFMGMHLNHKELEDVEVGQQALPLFYKYFATNILSQLTLVSEARQAKAVEEAVKRERERIVK